MYAKRTPIELAGTVASNSCSPVDGFFLYGPQ